MNQFPSKAGKGGSMKEEKVQQSLDNFKKNPHG
jgi:hypothetical protein